MKVRCDRSELAECLGDVLGIVPASQAQKPIFLDFHLKTEDARLTVEATDLEMAARISLERVEVLDTGEVALPALRLSSLIREIPDKTVHIEALEGGRGATVRAEGYEFKLLGEDPAEFPQVPAFSQEKAFSVPREKFVESLRRVGIAACRDLARYQLNGVFFEVEGEKLTLTATDGKRLTHDYIRIENPNKIEANAIVPNRVVDVLLKVLAQGDPTVSLVVGDPDVQASFGRGQVTAKVIQGRFPDYKVALPTKVNVRATAKKQDFLVAARTAALMTNKETATVSFKFTPDKAYLSTQATDIGESRIELPLTLEGESLEMRFNPTYFIDALRCLTEDEVRLEFLNAERPVALRSGQHYRHFVMPIVTAK